MPGSDAYEAVRRQATLADFTHMPLDKLPQEILDSLELVEETDLEGNYPADWGTYRTYLAPGLTIRTSAPSATYIEMAIGRKDWLTDKETFSSKEAYMAYVEGETDREWIIRVEITGGDYATLDGLRVGMTVEEAGALGYPLDRTTRYGRVYDTWLEITVEEGIFTVMENSWQMGRLIGKFFEL